MQLDGDPQVNDAGLVAVRSLIEDNVCRSAHYVAESPSTNTQAMNDLQQADRSRDALPRLYLTDSQTAGRGRLGRQWISSEGTLTFSLVVDISAFQNDAHLLSLVAGVGVARAIEHTCAPLNTKLKWPNDVYLSGAKVAGILVEGTQILHDVRVIGIGVNIACSPRIPDGHHAPPVTNLADATGRPQTRYAYLEPIVRSVMELIGELVESSSSIVSEFRSRCCLADHHVNLSMGTKEIQGICRGISDDGELIIETESGMQHCRSGEATRIRKSANRY